ncbi:hypothetical protein L3X38_036657 [Prunus dulcis]|uniref:Uncharacterized protein n=1 Tax=Prunus dulcis TaxID=3755 RepID=A0AAD4V1M4_PRUDU|nr:hypothetical protein L3X38_036657 [Prunus dulcis]
MKKAQEVEQVVAVEEEYAVEEQEVEEGEEVVVVISSQVTMKERNKIRIRQEDEEDGAIQINKEILGMINHKSSVILVEDMGIKHLNVEVVVEMSEGSPIMQKQTKMSLCYCPTNVKKK